MIEIFDYLSLYVEVVSRHKKDFAHTCYYARSYVRTCFGSASVIQESGEHYEMVTITNILAGEVVFKAAYDVGRGGDEIFTGTIEIGQRYLSQIQAAENFMRTVLN